MSTAHDHDHPAHLAHHFETSAQQMESGKLGMWIFLATEILMFGGLFCAYAIYRSNNPDVFLFAHRALDTTWGAINTVVLLASSFTMAWGVRAAQLGQKKLLVGLLIATMLGGAGFMLIKTVEYKAKWDHALFVGTSNAFYQNDGKLTNAYQAEHSADYIENHGAPHASNDHGDDHGSAHDDTSHDGDEHAASHDTHAEHAPPVEVSKITRPAAAPAGINPSLISNPHPAISVGESMTTGIGAMQAAHHGSHYPAFTELAPLDRGRTHIFFQIYFAMTGLHGLHVMIGLGLISWICYRAGGPLTRALLVPGLLAAVGLYFTFLWQLIAGPWWVLGIAITFIAVGIAWSLKNFVAARQQKDVEGEFSSEYYTPVDLVGLYWHLVDLIWIFLFPLLYLIH
ncbi:MAG: cytochrome c oxidase subunit 3 [Algisphaera sp.]